MKLVRHDELHRSGQRRAPASVGPLEHYWSLAIEEQFYWVWPLVVLLAFRIGRSWRARRTFVLVLAALAAVAAPVIA